jgi:very-short-patch-repair endonuclease
MQSGMHELEKPMYFGAKPVIFKRANELRKKMTGTEELLWERLKGKQVCGKRFRRQHPIDIFIADFYCHDARLVIEIDGEIHKQQIEYDDRRTAEMEKYYIKVMRFKNQDIENKIDKVLISIENEVRTRIKSPPWGI